MALTVSNAFTKKRRLSSSRYKTNTEESKLSQDGIVLSRMVQNLQDAGTPQERTEIWFQLQSWFHDIRRFRTTLSSSSSSSFILPPSKNNKPDIMSFSPNGMERNTILPNLHRMLYLHLGNVLSRTLSEWEILVRMKRQQATPKATTSHSRDGGVESIKQICQTIQILYQRLGVSVLGSKQMIQDTATLDEIVDLLSRVLRVSLELARFKVATPCAKLVPTPIVLPTMEGMENSTCTEKDETVAIEEETNSTIGVDDASIDTDDDVPDASLFCGSELGVINLCARILHMLATCYQTHLKNNENLHLLLLEAMSLGLGLEQEETRSLARHALTKILDGDVEAPNQLTTRESKMQKKMLSIASRLRPSARNIIEDHDLPRRSILDGLLRSAMGHSSRQQHSRNVRGITNRADALRIVKHLLSCRKLALSLLRHEETVLAMHQAALREPDRATVRSSTEAAMTEKDVCIHASECLMRLAYFAPRRANETIMLGRVLFLVFTCRSAKSSVKMFMLKGVAVLLSREVCTVEDIMDPNSYEDVLRGIKRVDKQVESLSPQEASHTRIASSITLIELVHTAVRSAKLSRTPTFDLVAYQIERDDEASLDIIGHGLWTISSVRHLQTTIAHHSLLVTGIARVAERDQFSWTTRQYAMACLCNLAENENNHETMTSDENVRKALVSALSSATDEPPGSAPTCWMAALMVQRLASHVPNQRMLAKQPGLVANLVRYTRLMNDNDELKQPLKDTLAQCAMYL